MASSSPPDPPSPKPSGPNYDTSNTLPSFFTNTYNILTGRISDEGYAQYRKDRDDRHEATDCARCEKHRDYLLQYSPIIRFMRDKINDLGADIHSGNVRCRRCTQRRGGGFEPEHGILLCANEMRNRGHQEDTMAHGTLLCPNTLLSLTHDAWNRVEMIHAYDHLRFHIDGESNLRHAACMEIRASSLSGECRWSREFFTRGQWKVSQQHQECVRRRAILSVMGRPACRGEGGQERATRAVDEVWESCFVDTRPFDDIYR